MKYRILHLIAIIALSTSVMACAQKSVSPTPYEQTADTVGPCICFLYHFYMLSISFVYASYMVKIWWGYGGIS